MPAKKVRSGDGILSKLIAERLRVPQAHGEFIVDTVFECIRELVLVHDKQIIISKFGQFLPYNNPPGYRITPQGNRVETTSFKKVRFRPSAACKTERVRHNGESLQEPKTSESSEE